MAQAASSGTEMELPQMCTGVTGLKHRSNPAASPLDNRYPVCIPSLPDHETSSCAASLFSLGLAAQWVEGESMPENDDEANAASLFETHPIEQLAASSASTAEALKPTARSRRGLEAARLFDNGYGSGTQDENATNSAAIMPPASKHQDCGVLLGSYARYPETMADSAIAQAEGVSRTTIWRRRQKQLARLDGELSGTKVRERNVRQRKGMRRATSEEVV
jgi:hypothetical protein